MKKLSLILLILLGACSNQQVVLPLFIYDMQDAYMADFEENIRLASPANLPILTLDANGSQIIQNEQIDLQMKDHEILIINPVDRLSVFSIIEKAKVYKNKIIFFNRQPLESDMQLYDQVYYVGADAVQSAVLQASLIMDLFGNPNKLNAYDLNQDNSIQVVILKGEQGHQDAEARTEYVIASLTDANYHIEVLDIGIANWDYDSAKQQMDDWMKQYPDQIELVISNNDVMALGALDTLKEVKRIDDVNLDGLLDRNTEPWLPVVGIDGLDAAIESMKQGYLYGTIRNDSIAMANAIIELAMALQNETSLDSLTTPLTQGQYIWVNYQKLSLEDE